MRNFLVAFLFPAALAAQSWVGPAALSVEVEDAKGKPVAGAEVTLTYAGSPAEEGGPGVVTTDAKGRATVRGLAAGTWVIEIRHPSYMVYSADLAVEPGKAPRASAAALLKAGASFESFKVKYARAEGAAPRPSTPEPPAPAPKPAPRPEQRPEPRPETRPPATAPTPPPTQAPKPMPAPAPTPTEAPKPVTPAPTPAPKPMPAPESAPTPPPKPAPPAPATPAPDSRPTPTPAPTPSVTPAPAPAPVTPPPAAPAPPPRLRSHRDGSCPECQPGEWAIDARVAAGTGGAGCPADVAARVTAGLPTDASELAGRALALRDATGAFRPEASRLAAGLGELSGAGRCQVLVAFVPAPAKFIGFQFQGRTATGPVGCTPDGACPGGGRFFGPPALKKNATGTYVAVAFERSAEGGGVAEPELVVYFSQQGWKPPVR